MAFQPANRTLILRGLTCLLTLAGLVLLLEAVAPGTASATGADVPEAPRNLRVSPGESGELVVSWEAPAGDGGSAISGYQVQWKSGSEDYDGAPESTRQAVTGNDRLTHTIGDLKDGTAYTVRVIATNGVGDGAPSAEATAAPRPAPAPEGQPAGPRDDSGEDGVYTWRDGDRIIPVRIETKRAVQGRTDRRSDVKGDSDYRTESIVSVSVGGDTMSLPGGVLVVLNPSWSKSRTGTFFSKNGIAPGRVSRLESMNNTFVVETAPGLPSLRLANALATQDGVRVASPNWQMEVEAQQTPEQDDHGDTPDTATDLPLNTPVAGVISSDADDDYFRFELTESTFFVVANFNNTTGVAQSFEVFDVDGNKLLISAMARIRLAAGTYYVKVSWDRISRPRPNYNVEVRTIDDHGDTVENATPLEIRPRSVFRQIFADFHSPDDVDYFKFEVDKPSWIKLDAGGRTVHNPRGRNFLGVNLDLFDGHSNALRHPIKGLTFEGRPYWLEAGTYYARFSPYIFRLSSGNIHPFFIAPYNVDVFEDTDYTEFIDECSAIQTSFGDPLFGCHWHLDNTATNSGTAGQDVNVDSAWAITQGEGVNVVIVDDEISFDHEDLEDNWDPNLGYNYVEPEKEVDPRQSHGLMVAGIIAARDNNLGGRGVAPRTTIFGHNFSRNSNLVNAVDALTRNSAVAAVSNNSWMLRNTRGTRAISEAWVEALETGVNEGFHGKGTFYAFAAGNSHPDGFHVNLNEGKNHYTQTLVCAVTEDGTRDELSETSYSLWLCAPAASFSTDLWDRYTNDFGGTSAATAVVSGVAALLRSANPDLTWRDLKLVLAASARNSDPANTGWETGALKYGSDTDRYSYNPEYGFGVVDAGAAVELATNWANVPPMLTAEARKAEVQRAIPDPDGGSVVSSVSSQIELETGIEFVEVRIDVNHPAFRDIGIELISPSGATSKLAVPDDQVPDEELTTKFRLGSARHLGEAPNGTWTLRVTDHYASEEGTFSGWELTVYGHSRVPVRPRILSLTSGPGEIEVTWAAPQGLPPDSYKVQWKEASGSWDAPGDVSEQVITGVLPSSFTITYLTDGVRYTVRVIASNSVGDSAPSAEVAASPGSNPPTGLPTIWGTARVGETLTALTGGIEDADGMTGATFTYQWISSDGQTEMEIDGATGRRYSLVTRDEGKTIKVRVRFRDDDGHEETLTSASTTAVAAALGICGRTRAVRSGIAGALATMGFYGAYNCANVTQEHLKQMTYLSVSFRDGEDLSLQSLDFRGLPKLEKLAIGGVVTMPEDVFDELPGLKKLTLTSQKPISLPENVLDELSSLERLRLGYVLSSLPERVFDELSNLKKLDLNSNNLSSLPSGVFRNLSSLESLFLQSNEFTALLDGMFEGLTSLQGLWLNHNPRDPFTLTAELEQRGDNELLVKIREGTPFDVTVTLAAAGGSLSTTRATIDGGKSSSSPIEVTPFGDDPVTVTVVTAVFSGGQVRGGVRTGTGEALTLQDDAGVNTPATGAPTISGTAQVGEMLTADASGISDADGLTNVSFDYQWLADDIAIAGATGWTYTLAGADEGKVIKVNVSFTDDAGSEESLTSPAIDTVAAQPNSPAAGQPTISDTAQVGETLTADTSGIADEDGLEDATFSYQWLADDTAIQGATNFAYALVKADEGKTVKVRVSFTDDAGNEESLTSAARAAVAPRPNSPATGAPAIIGTAQVGETFAADTSGINDADGLTDVGFSYQWIRNDGTTDTDISEATGETYILLEAG